MSIDSTIATAAEIAVNVVAFSMIWSLSGWLFVVLTFDPLVARD
jgi:hypothetical protein